MKTKNVRTSKEFQNLKKMIKAKENFNVCVDGVYFTHLDGIVTKLEKDTLFFLVDGEWVK